MGKCRYWPTDDELNRDGPFCWGGSDISGTTGPCTEEEEKACDAAHDHEGALGMNEGVPSDGGFLS